MFLLIAGIILGIIGIIVALSIQRVFPAVLGVIVATLLIIFSTFYTQEVGEAMVIKNADGTIASTDIDAGLGTKAPWQDTISFDIKGQQGLFKADGKSTQPGEEVDGPEITVAGTDKVPVNVDIAIRYSLAADKVDDIYTEYKTEEVLKQRLIIQDIKSIVKDSANGMNVDSLISDRAAYSKKIEENLKTRWADKGVIVDSVALQTVRPPQSILDRINASQAAQQQLVQAQANTKVKEEEARQRVIEAKGVADANNTLNGSLTENVLKDKYIEALKNAKSLVVVPNGSTPMVSVPQETK